MEYLQKSFYLKSPTGKMLAASAVWPESGKIAGALLIVPPLVEERKALLPPLTEFSRKIAVEHSIVSLRIDLSGTGDSEGELTDASAGEWVDEIESAAGILKSSVFSVQSKEKSLELRAKSLETPDGEFRVQGSEFKVSTTCNDGRAGIPSSAADGENCTLNNNSAFRAPPSALKIALLGVRTGAMLALSAAVRIEGISSVLLWDPVTGDESVKQWLQRRMINDMMAYGKARVSRAGLIDELEKGGIVDLDGFPISGALYAELKNLTYGGFAPDKEQCAKSNVQFCTHVIVSGRPLPSLQKWVETANNVSIEEVKLPPYWNSVGYIDTLPLQEVSAKWLAGRLDEEKAVFDFPIIPAAENSAERIVEIPSCEHTVRGVYVAPVLSETSTSTCTRAVLFLGGWSGDRQGPHRLFTEYARHLSARGIASLRIDYLGRGESGLSHSEADIQMMARNGVDAVKWLCAETGLASADIVAICSGCKVAITVSTLSGNVRDMILWSAEAMGSLRSKNTNSKKTTSAFKVYFKKLSRLETWKKIFTGRVNTSMVGKALAAHETRSAAEAKNEDKTLDVFKDFNGNLTFVYGGSDPDAKLASEAYSGFCKKHSLKSEFHLIPNAGHSYYALDWTDTLIAVTDGSMRGHGEG